MILTEKELAARKEIVRPVEQLPFIIRAIWFVVLGWELAAVWIVTAWLLNLTIIGLPLGIWMLDRVPQVLTLQAMPGAYVVNRQTGAAHYAARPQVNFLLRAVYFVVFGWWVSMVWAILAYLFCLTIIGLPLGVLMLNRLPFVTTLRV